MCATELIFCINPKSNRLFVCLLFNTNFPVTSRQLQPFIDSKILPQSSLQGIISFHKRKNMKYTLNSWHQHQEPQIETKHKTVKNNLNILFHLILSYLILSYLKLYIATSHTVFPHPNPTLFVPNPYQIIGTVLSQHKIKKTHKVSTCPCQHLPEWLGCEMSCLEWVNECIVYWLRSVFGLHRKTWTQWWGSVRLSLASSPGNHWYMYWIID